MKKIILCAALGSVFLLSPPSKATESALFSCDYLLSLDLSDNSAYEWLSSWLNIHGDQLQQVDYKCWHLVDRRLTSQTQNRWKARHPNEDW